MKRNPAAIAACYFAIYVIWGSTYLGIRWVVQSMPPFYLVGIRFFSSGLVFLAVAVATGKLRAMPSPGEVLSSAFLGCFLILGGNGFVSIGETSVESYIASIIICSTPFCVAFFNRVIFRERLLPTRLAGMVLGLAGVVAIAYSGSARHVSFTWGIPIVVAGFLCWGLATSLSRRLPVHEDNLVNTGMQMTIAGAIALIVSQFAYPPVTALLPAVSARSWWALIYLSTAGSAAFAAYNYLLKHEPSIRVVSYSIVNPLIAVLLGILVAGEAPVPLLAVGMPMIVVALVLVLYGEQLARLASRALGPGRGRG
jgi:drug/metabolite transporter (DMT)-like permease